VKVQVNQEVVQKGDDCCCGDTKQVVNQDVNVKIKLKPRRTKPPRKTTTIPEELSTEPEYTTEEDGECSM